jgi:hypothetical protein
MHVPPAQAGRKMPVQDKENFIHAKGIVLLRAESQDASSPPGWEGFSRASSFDFERRAGISQYFDSNLYAGGRA